MPENPYAERTLYIRDDRTGELVPYTPPLLRLEVPRMAPPFEPPLGLRLATLGIKVAAIAGIILIVAAFSGVLA